MTGAWPNASENAVASIVAEVTTIFRSFLRRISSRRYPSRKSMFRLRSWASSMMIVSYSSRSGSCCISASSMPSVIILTRVSATVSSVNRILHPTSLPQVTPSSSAMRRETDNAATRRGCVHAMRPYTPRPASRHILGSCVVLPEPVSPVTMTTGCPRRVSSISSFFAAIGSWPSMEMDAWDWRR